MKAENQKEGEELMVQLGWREYFFNYESHLLCSSAQAHEPIKREKLQMEKINGVRAETLGHRRRWDPGS